MYEYVRELDIRSQTEFQPLATLQNRRSILLDIGSRIWLDCRRDFSSGSREQYFPVTGEKFNNRFPRYLYSGTSSR